MITVSFKNKGISVDVEEGTLLSDCIRKVDLSIETPCNCIGLCGKCKVRVIGALSPIEREEARFLDGENIRLACAARAMGPVEIELLEYKKALNTVNRGYSIDVLLNSTIKGVKLNEFNRKTSTPYLKTLNYKLASYNLLEKIVEIDSSKYNEIYGVLYNDKLINITNKRERLLGVAVDIGTTGISAYLVDMETGEVLNRVSALNPQTEYGGDVLTRISFCMNNRNGNRILKDAIISKINEVIKELVDVDYEARDVYRITIAGNTTMLHLLLGINPVSIARAPYRPVFLDCMDIAARELNININSNGIITLLPSASGYVGSDIIAGVAATAFNEKEHSSIFIDIGTNGEIVGISNGKMAATSTAAGPALEGMNISCGCRAEVGAIDTFSIDDDYNISFTTIGEASPIGICGSGLIDVAAALVNKKIILSSGKFNNDMYYRIKDRFRDKKFYITENICISQNDIRQIQLAKGAIAAGVNMLLKEIGITIGEVEEAVIAGAFGYHINPESIKDIGIIPKGFMGKISFVGNSSVEGARLALISKEVTEKMIELKNQISILELSTKEEFQECFVKELRF
jgi:uncharacterized 2Fe-2S/4Fe-4S cluster protein (DUF4445 family)